MRILLAGVGGQGILFVTRVLGELALTRGWSVMGSETHGMAQRGGSVVSHLKIDEEGVAPFIRPGTCDLLLGLEESEGLRYVGFLRTEGRFMLDEGRSRRNLPVLRGYLKENRITVRKVPASRLAHEIPYPMGANLVLLGAAQAAQWLPFTQKEMEEVVAALSRPALQKLNLESLRCGWRAEPA